jgi:hypothetical protein
LRTICVEPRERGFDDPDALTRVVLSACPSDQQARPIAVVREPVALAQPDGRFRALQRPLAIEPHLVQEAGICERQRLAVLVVSSPSKRERVIRARHRSRLVAEQPQRVRRPGAGEDAKV